MEEKDFVEKWYGNVKEENRVAPAKTYREFNIQENLAFDEMIDRQPIAQGAVGFAIDSQEIIGRRQNVKFEMGLNMDEFQIPDFR